MLLVFSERRPSLARMLPVALLAAACLVAPAGQTPTTQEIANPIVAGPVPSEGTPGDPRFDVAYMAWGGLVFPNPETMWHSMLADVPNNNNLTGFKDPRVDRLLPMYDREFDQQKRVAIIREIDGILANAHHYALAWDAPFHRIAYWNKFGHPEGYLTRVGDQADITTLWWRDPQKEADLARAMRDSSAKLAVGTTEVRYWQEYAQRQPSSGAPVAGQ